MSGKTHWKKLNNPEYLGAYSLDEGKDLTVTIESVTRQIVKGEGGKQEECTIAKLKGQKPMILNVTNCKTIAALYKSPYIEDWAGKQIILYAANIAIKGEMMECLRVRPKLPVKATLPELTPDNPKWSAVQIAIQQGTATPEQARSKFYISEANMIKLQEDAI